MASDTNISSATFESRLTTLETNFAVFVQEMKDFKQEMRNKDNQRVAEMAEIRQSLQTMNYQNIFVIIGVVAIAVAVFLK